MTAARCYEVLGYWPPEKRADGSHVHHGRHIGVFVVCNDASRAAAVVESKYPGIRVDSVNCKGNREVIVVESVVYADGIETDSDSTLGTSLGSGSY